MVVEPADELSAGRRLESAKWNQLREEILARDDHQCANCGAESNLEVHHIVPLHRGGTNKQTNLVTVCKSCHNGSHGQEVRDPNAETEKRRWLPSIEEIQKLVQTTNHPLKQAIIGLLAKTGIGVGELCNLRLQDVFLDDENFSDEYNIQKPDWVISNLPSLRIRVEGEDIHSPRRERTDTTLIPLDNQTRDVLRRWLSIRPDSYRQSQPLFLSTQMWGSELSLASVHALVESRATPLGFVDSSSELDSLTPYSLRYFFAERFSGQPSVRDYLLTGCECSIAFEQLVAHYRSNVFSIF